MAKLSKFALSTMAAMIVVASAASGFFGVLIGRQLALNIMCCQVPRSRNIVLSVKEILGLARFYSQIGQDKWVSETVFPDVRNGFFLDVGSGDGTFGSNTKELEEKGWTGICIDPFPKNMQGRTCQMFKEVVYSKAGEKMTFRTAGDLGGLEDNLGRWKSEADKAAGTVDFTTVILGDILERAHAPHLIQFISLDIEGAELEALRGFPFDQYKFGALAVEHNYEETKRSGMEKLLNSQGYTRVYTWYQDDFYLPANP